jgi:hypothetical protein
MRHVRYSDYRSWEFLVHVMIWECDAVSFNNSVRGICPTKDCPANRKRSLVCSGKAPVCYCHGCYRSFDALALLAAVHGYGLDAAADDIDKKYSYG